MRIFNELNGRNQGVYLTREMIKKELLSLNGTSYNSLGFDYEEIKGLKIAIRICNDLLDIATLGEIEERRDYDIQKENGTI